MPEGETIYKKITVHPLLSKVIDDLTYNQFLANKNIGLEPIKIPFEEIKKCIWLTSILVGSNNEDDIKKAQLFTALTYLQYQDNPVIEKACYLLLSRAGNLTAARLLNHFSLTGNSNTNIFEYDAVVNLELAIEWDDKLITSNNSTLIASKFQKKLWTELKQSQRISISAPTSAGKSYIIKNYILNNLSVKEEYKILYIAPSRALLNQVSAEFRSQINSNDIDIKTAFIEDELKEEKKKQIYILTPERCLRLIKGNPDKPIKIDLIFVDEIQNVENEEGRGSLLEYVLRELSSRFFAAQIIAAGPNIIDTTKLFYKIFGDISVPVETSISPVFQLKTVIRPLADKKIKITLKSSEKREQSFEIKTDFDFRKKINKNYGEALPDIIKLFAPNQQNIIYSPKTDLVEEWALSFAKHGNDNTTPLHKDISELIEFLADEIHPKYYLGACLAAKSAFHHSKLPDIVRKEIEDGFLEGKIINLFCTSTLLEGVNLPANNLFIVSAKKRSTDLTAFEFGNLIGRAGRIKDSLYGTIYCIDRNNGDWAEEYYDKGYAKEVISVMEKAFEDFDNFLLEVKKPVKDISKAKDLNTIIFLRHKFLNTSVDLIEYLEQKGIERNKAQALFSELSLSLINLNIPASVSRLNPSLDPILQNELYKKIKDEGLSQWLVGKDNFWAKTKKEAAPSMQFEELNSYYQLVSIFNRLDEIFGITLEVFKRYSISLSVKQMCLYGIKWMKSRTYKQLINEDLNYKAHIQKKLNLDDDDAVNTQINQLIKINSVVVTHVLVKYLKLVCDLAEAQMTEEDKIKYSFSLSLPTKMELGTSEKVVIQLISRGVSRSVALKVFNVFKRIEGYEDKDVFAWLKTKTELPLKPIYNRYLSKMNLLQKPV